MSTDSTPVFRFAPSPNGWLHLGHALSAIMNAEAAQRRGGRFLLRIEDIDIMRARDEYVAGISEDLHWLGLSWEEPVRRQSQFMADYARALERLRERGVLYPCICSRTDIARAVEEKERKLRAPWPRDPDGAPLYPGTCRRLAVDDKDEAAIASESCAWRLDMDRALQLIGDPIVWTECPDDDASARIVAEPRAWGDIVVARKDIGTSYHLAVVVDDALQGVTHVIRGRDLYHATSVQRVLQELLGLPEPLYTHHRLVLDEAGAKLSKSAKSTSLRELRAQGQTPADVRALLGVSRGLFDRDAKRPEPEHGCDDGQRR